MCVARAGRGVRDKLREVRKNGPPPFIFTVLSLFAARRSILEPLADFLTL